MTRRDLEAAIARSAGAAVTRVSPLSGGCVGDVFKVALADGRTVVAKAGGPDSLLATEGLMLRYLGERGLPVPDVIAAGDDLLMMTFVETAGGLDDSAQRHAAELLAALHGHSADRFGFERATPIGGLPQPNAWEKSWLAFFRDRRLLAMAEEAQRVGQLPARAMHRIERLAARLCEWIEEPKQPSLIHGDAWGGNVLCRRGRVAAFIDPAIYYADPEIELAFGTLFSTFGRPFFERYRELRPIRPGFFEERRDLYNLYPLLVHVRLFGGSYLGSVEATLTKLGC